MNPGAPSNNERTGDRDLYISGLFRRTKGTDMQLKQCDVDSLPELFPVTVCDGCKLPVAFIEFTRSSEYKATTYLKAWSCDMQHQVPVYCIRHNGCAGTVATIFEVEQRYCPKTHAVLFKKDVVLTSETEFIEWLQNIYEHHLTICGAKKLASTRLRR